MRALLGYIFAVSILLGSAYAGLEWLSAPEPLSAEKSVAHGTKPADKLAPTRLSKVAGPGAADRKPDGAVAGKTASEERSDGTGQESRQAQAIRPVPTREQRARANQKPRLRRLETQQGSRRNERNTPGLRPL